NGVDMIALLASKTSFLKSNGEARRALAENSISVNKIKVDESYNIGTADLIDDQYILLQRGKKNYFIVEAVS
ncbi:MAG: tyrosine--tRNA ligase, partial [Bacteroidota bacterium]|nr:tyrosine--tRNA ligase [Bacteroidota bacterium]